MAQAKRKHRASPASRKKYSYQGLGMLLVGMVIGSLATILWQGMKVADGGVGTGIRQMIDQSRDKDQEEIAQQSVSVEDRPVEQQTNFDFFTVNHKKKPARRRPVQRNLPLRAVLICCRRGHIKTNPMRID
jgi:flagellar basal body-associated protein FliL